MPNLKNPTALLVAALIVSCTVFANAQTGTTGFAPRSSAVQSPAESSIRKNTRSQQFGSVTVRNNLRQLEQQKAADRRRQQEAERLQFLRDQQLINQRGINRQAVINRTFGGNGSRQGMQNGIQSQSTAPGSFRSEGFFAAKPAPADSPGRQAAANRPVILPAPRSVTIRNEYSSSSFEPTGYTGGNVSAPEPTQVTNPFFSKLESENKK